MYKTVRGAKSKCELELHTHLDSFVVNYNAVFHTELGSHFAFIFLIGLY